MPHRDELVRPWQEDFSHRYVDLRSCVRVAAKRRVTRFPPASSSRGLRRHRGSCDGAITRYESPRQEIQHFEMVTFIALRDGLLADIAEAWADQAIALMDRDIG